MSIGDIYEAFDHVEKENKALKERNEWLLEGVSQSEIVLRDSGHEDKADKLLEIMRKLKVK